MTQEEKLLLLKDLSARLPYGVIVNYKKDEYDFHHWKISTLYAPAYSQSGSLINTDSDGWIEYTEYKGCGLSTGSRPLHIDKTLPYLRPMSSMTEEEIKEWDNICVMMRNMPVESIPMVFRFVSSKHLDYNNLISKGLALEAPEGMYNLND